MAKKQESKEESIKDEDARVRYIKEQTSSDARFSTYRRIPSPDPLGGDIIQEFRGEPKDG